MSAKYQALFGRVCSYVAQFLIIAALPLILPPELFTKYNLVMPVLMLGSSVIYGWLNGAAFRWAHKVASDEDQRLGTAITYYYLALLIISLLITIGLASTGHIYECLIPFAIFALSIKDYFLKLSNACEDYTKFFKANGLLLLGKLIFLALLYIYKISNFEMILLLFIASEFIFLIPFIKNDRVFRKPSFATIVKTLGEMLRYGGPLIAASIATWVISLSDRYILALYADKTAVANYILVYQFAANAITVPLVFFITLFFPTLLKIEREHGLDAALQRNKVMLAKYFFIAPIYSAIVCASLYFALKFFYQKYQADLLLIAVVMASQAILGASQFYNKKYELDNRTHLIAISVFISALLDVCCNLIMIPRIGAMGAAYSAVIANTVLILITVHIDKFANKSNPYPSVKSI